MPFRANEATLNGYERAKSYLIHREITAANRVKSLETLADIIDSCGPVIDGYPTWHPLVTNHKLAHPVTWPGVNCGYSGLDHTVCFAHGFITCPYGDGHAVMDSVANLPDHPVATISAKRLGVQFYTGGTTAILVRCDWLKSLELEKTIPKSLAVPLMVEKELPMWRWSDLAENWETMRPYLLGNPCGKRSSLFVSQDTALAMKKAYMALVESGMFGPLKMN